LREPKPRRLRAPIPPTVPSAVTALPSNSVSAGATPRHRSVTVRSNGSARHSRVEPSNGFSPKPRYLTPSDPSTSWDRFDGTVGWSILSHTLDWPVSGLPKSFASSSRIFLSSPLKCDQAQARHQNRSTPLKLAGRSSALRPSAPPQNIGVVTRKVATIVVAPIVPPAPRPASTPHPPGRG